MQVRCAQRCSDSSDLSTRSASLQEGMGPYQRRPLSKKCLLGEIEEDALALKPRSYYVAKALTCYSTNGS